MSKEEIYEYYWKELIKLKRQFFGYDLETNKGYLNLKKQLVLERNILLERFGHNLS